MTVFSSITQDIFGHDKLTVPEASGLIAAGVFLVQFAVPLALPIILLGLIKERDSITTVPAVTWSVVGQFLHSSLWPTILSADSASTTAVPNRVIIITKLKIVLAVLIAIAAIVTPMGLYESIVASESPTPSAFHYVQDESPFGQGTPPRGDLPWSRLCGSLNPVACPNSFSNVTYFSNATADYYDIGRYDSGVPRHVVDAFQSGLSAFNKSVSSIFNIQGRYYSWSRESNGLDTSKPDNGTSYVVTDFRPIQSLALENKITLVEGLVVDMVNGGVGFRNHSAPPVVGYGSEWSEDILFIEPESQCVDTNLTIDFMIPKYYSDKGLLSNLVLTDRGGFANLTQEYPSVDVYDAQNHPNLRERAYKAAWINNAYSMAFMNVTSLKNESDPNSHAFTYLNTTVGKRFPLQYPNSSFKAPMSIDTYSIQSSGIYGLYLQTLDEGVDEFNSTSIFNSSENFTIPSIPPLYSNPFNVTSDYFSGIRTICRGAGGTDIANISNIATECGLLYGSPRPQDGGSPLLFRPGSNWTIPIYSCISATKAVIKNVRFRFNGSDDLSGVTVTRIADKTYSDDSSKPLWAVEKTDMLLRDVNPIWGIVSSPDQGNISLSTLRKESLYLPGFANMAGTSTFDESRNLPGTKFHLNALSTAYEIGSTDVMEYTGKSSLALAKLWQRCSRHAASSHKVLNLVWTDLAANAVVGTRGMHEQSGSIHKRAAASQDDDLYPVLNHHRRIRYHLQYAIPAIIVLVLTVLILLATLVSCIRDSGIRKLKRFLMKTSQARILTARLYGTSSPEGMNSDRGMWSDKKGWRETTGRKEISLSQHHEQVVIHDSKFAERTEPLLEEPIYLSSMK